MAMVRKSLNLVTFNVGSLVHIGRRIELSKLLIQFNIEIAFLQELHLPADANVYLDNYIILRDNSPLGVGIAIRNSISYSRVTISNIRFPNLFVELRVSVNGNIRRILCGSIYFPSNCNRQIICDGLSSILNLSGQYDGLILGGDLNAKHITWGDNNNNFNGEIISNWVQNESISVMRICDSYPTYPGGSSHLDHFIVSTDIVDNVNHNFKTYTLPTFSDHVPLGLEIFFDDVNFILGTPDCFMSFKDTNWNGFKIDISETISNHFPPHNRNLSDDEIDYFVDEFSTSLNFVTQIHSRMIDNKNRKYIVSDKVKNMLRIKYNWQKDLKRIYTRTLNRKHPEYLLISKQIDLIKILIKEQVEIEQANIFDERLSKIKPGPFAYKQIFGMIGNRKRSYVKDVSVNGVNIDNLNEKLETFKNHFSNVYQNSPPDRDLTEIKDTINNTISQSQNFVNFDNSNTSLNNRNHPRLTNLNEILTTSKMINNKKSCGLDNISNYIIKRLPMKAFEYLTILYNNCLNNGYFPSAWKIAKIVPIPKQKGNNEVSSFRPISLLSNLGKMFERIIRDKMDIGLSETYIPQSQFGFKKGNSTVHALLKFHTDVVQNLRKGECTLAVSLDIEKAFDKAYHDGILFKMIEIGIDASIVKLFKSFFDDRKFCVQIGEMLSDQGMVSCGVPQGSVLAPHLYSIFIYDFPHEYVNSKGILYADDSLLYTHDESPLIALQSISSYLNHVDDFYSHWGIKINTTKSKALCIRNASGKCKYTVVPESKNLKLRLNNTEIIFKDSMKYLGVNFDKLLKFNKHANYNLERANKVKGVFSRLFNNRYLPITTKLLLYKVSIRTILLYAFPIWFTVSKTTMRKMEIFERHILRKCIGKHFKSNNRKYSNREVYEKAGIDPLAYYALNLAKHFVDRLSFFEGSIMQDILSDEQNFNWSNTNYLNIIGILQEQHNSYPGPNFYSSTTPGIHRG